MVANDALSTNCSQCGRSMKAPIPGGLHSREYVKFVVKVCGVTKCVEKASAAWEEEKRTRRRLVMSEGLVAS